MIVVTFLLALAVTVAVRGPGPLIGLVGLAALFVPIERRWALRRQPVFRRFLLTDLTHFTVNSLLVAGLTAVFVVAAALPFLWIRALDAESYLPVGVAAPLAVLLVLLGQYWGHRLAHEVPFLWRFHSVHHSIERMDWVASARLHPVDQAFTQTVIATPLFLLGYDRVAIVGVGAAVAVLALFQHANVRVRFPGLRWVVNTPEWHHWHHARDAAAWNRNYGVPVVDLAFGTAYLPARATPTGFGIDEPVPQGGYWRHLAHPFRSPRRAELTAAS